jgi:hypothetical protein
MTNLEPMTTQNRQTQRFRITFDTLTEESAVNGDSARCGFITNPSGEIPAENEAGQPPALFTLREAVEILRGHGDRFEADSSPCEVARWVTAYPPDSVWRETGENTSLSLHIPENISTASARRVTRALARELRVYGVKP